MNLIAPSTVDGMCPSVPMHCAVNLGGSGEGAVERARGPGRASGRRSQSACAPPEWTFSSGKSISLTHSLLPMPAPDATDGPDVVHRFPSFLGRCFSSLRTLPPSLGASVCPSVRRRGRLVLLADTKLSLQIAEGERRRTRVASAVECNYINDLK